METIIVQDTEKDILDILTIILQEGGFNVYPLMNFEEDFLTIIEKTRPHVVMLDYRLTGKSCEQVLNKIRAAYHHLPVIAMSCNSNINEIYDKIGFDDYISKPFDIDVLYATLRRHIPKKE